MGAHRGGRRDRLTRSARLLALAAVGATGLTACGQAPQPAAGMVVTPSRATTAVVPSGTPTSEGAQAPTRPSTALSTRVAPGAQASVAAAVPPRIRKEVSKPAFRSSVVRVDARALGSSWRSGCPVGPQDLRAVSVTYRGFDGRAHVGVLVVHRDIATRVVAVFSRMYAVGFPLRSVRPVTDFGSSDDASMAADNTSAFNCRRAVASGPPTWSRHAYGKAIDVNPVENPYLFAGRVLPPAGAAFTSRARPRPGLIRRGDAVHRAFTGVGFRWGGTFSNPDYQHFDIR